jgi:hypothetical protein
MRQTRYLPCLESTISAYKILVQKYEGRRYFGDLVEHGDGVTFTFTLKKCGLKCRCVIRGSVYRALFYFMFFGDFILNDYLYDTVLE